MTSDSALSRPCYLSGVRRVLIGARFGYWSNCHCGWSSRTYTTRKAAHAEWRTHAEWAAHARQQGRA